MTVRVARGAHVVSAPDMAGPDRRYLLIPVPVAGQVQYVDSLVQATSFAEIRGADAVVLRLHPSTAATLFNHPECSQILSDIQHRAAGVPVLLLTWHEGAPQFFRCTEQTWVRDPVTEQAMCQADLWSLLQQPGCVLTPTPEFHYEGPNGSHFRGFVRPGLARIIHEGAGSNRDTKASAWYKAVATRTLSHDGGL